MNLCAALMKTCVKRPKSAEWDGPADDIHSGIGPTAHIFELLSLMRIVNQEHIE